MTVSHVREILLAVVIALSATTALAQTTATLAGTIQDVAGSVLSGADISIVNTGTGAPRSAVSGENGRFVVGGLSAGTYDVHVDLDGFRPS